MKSKWLQTDLGRGARLWLTFYNGPRCRGKAERSIIGISKIYGPPTR